MRLAKRTVIILLTLFGLTCVLVSPGFPVGTAAVTPRVAAQKGASSGLDSSRQAEMERLYSQFKAGDPFSEEEGNILRNFAAGAAITNLEADLVISRALFDYYLAAKELTKEQQGLLDEYSQFVARRSTDIADLKTQLLNRRIAAAAAAPPRTAPLAPPSNDTCAGAEVIPAGGPFPHLTAVTADITDATVSGDPPLPSCQNLLSRSIWYTFTPSTTAAYTISSCSSDGTSTTVDDTVIAIYTSTGGCGGTFTEIPTGGASDGCDDDSCVSEALQAIITTQLNSGTQYYIVVWQFGSTAPTAGNTAVQLSVSQVAPPANDTCASATVLALNTPVSGTTGVANNDYQLSGAACFTGVGQTASAAAGRDVVYSFTASTADTYSFKVSNFDTIVNLVVYVASTCPGGAPPVTVTTCLSAANRSTGSTAEEVYCVPLSASQTVFVFVDENSTSVDGSPFTLEVSRCNPEIEPNDTPGTANPVFFGGESSIGTAGDVDFFSLGTPAADSRVFAMIDGVASNGNDFDMRVTTAVDTLEYDDFNLDLPFGDLSAAVAGTLLTGVPSFLRVDYFPGTGGVHEPYRIYSVVQPPGASALPGCAGPGSTSSATPETEPNNVIGDANSAGNKYFSGALAGPAPSTDVDIFSFTASAGELIFLSLDGDPCRNATPINAGLELLDSAGGILIGVNDSGSTSDTTPGAGSLASTTPSSPAEGLVWRATYSGAYYARVAIGTTSTGGTGEGDYLLSIFTGGPTAAKFSNDGAGSAARATRFDDGVSVRWRTGFETDNLGFNIYRYDNGTPVRVNSQLIAGSALVVGAGTSLGAGKSYAWFDNAPASRNAQYLIEAVDLNGESTWYGPVSSNQATRISSTGDRATSPILGETSKSSPIESQTTLVDRRASIRMVSSSGVSIQGPPSGRAAVKLGVKNEGFYRVTQPELVAAGFDARVDPRYLRLFVDGREQPINVVSRGAFDSSSAIEFYGVGVDSASTDEHVYWLTAGEKAGLRIQSVSARAKPAFSQSFLSTVELKPRSIYFAGLRNGDKENFFGTVIARDPVDQVLSLQHVDASANGASLEVALQGVTVSGHRVEVQINGARVGEVVFDGQDAGIARLPVSQSLLREGANIVSLLPLGGPADISLVDYLRLSYWHTFVADNNELRFNALPQEVISVEGFSNADIRVLDVTDPNAPQEVLGVIRPNKSGYSVTIRVHGSGLRTLVAMTSDRTMRAANITLDQVSKWRQSTNAADLVIFTRREFMLAVNSLKELRQSQGYRVAVVDIEDVYDEFSFGNKTPLALKDFLAYAHSNWKVAPRFVMMVGDASFDAKNYLGFGWNDFVPTGLIDTQLMETASDDWLADFNGDGLAEMAIGRLPVRSPREAAVVVAKIVHYEQSSRSEGVLLVADETLNGADFETTSAELRRLIPDDQRVEEINRGGLDPATAKSRLLEAINRGQRVINYNGHGNFDSWRGSFLTAEDVNQLSNGDNLALFVMMTCLNGYFHDAQFNSLAEALLGAEKGGAVALWASSAMTNPGDQGVMDIEMFRRLFDPDTSLTLGEISLQAKKKALNKDARLSWILFGDPTTRLR